MTEVPITVLMPAYNAAQYIAEAIQSVLEQTFTNFELLIVNDGSTDHTSNVIASFTDPRIRVINQVNGGVSVALNAGLSEARGTYIARFDADDVCYPYRLEQQYLFMQANPDYVVIGSDADYMSEEGEFLFTYNNTGYSNEEIKSRINDYCPFVHSSVFYARKSVLDVGGYEPRAHSFEDYFLWVKLIKYGKVCNFRQPLIKVRFNPSSVTVDEKDRTPRFNELKKKAMQTGHISEEEGIELLINTRKLNPDKKLGSYHRMIAKKYLWNNYQPAKARRHLLSSLKHEPLKRTSYLLYFFSFLPQRLIRKIYNMK